MKQTCFWSPRNHLTPGEKKGEMLSSTVLLFFLSLSLPFFSFSLSYWVEERKGANKLFGLL